MQALSVAYVSGFASKTRPHSKRKSWSLEVLSPENFTGACASISFGGLGGGA